MLSRITITTLLFFLSVTLLNASTLVWDRTEVHVDMEPDQEEVRETFTVTNEGEKAVRIARIKTSCGCTGSIINKKIIGPGESTEIVATFNKGKRQGLNRNRLQVYLDSQPEPIVTLLMSARIPTLIEAMPQIVYWSSESSKTERRVRITMDEQYIDKIDRIEYDRSQLTITEEPGDPETGTDRVLIVKPKDFNTLYRGSITIYGSGPEGRKTDIRVHTFVQP